MVNSKQSYTRSKSILKTAERKRDASVQGTLPSSHKEINEDEESLNDILC